MTDPNAEYESRTVARPIRVEVAKIKGSRFVCDVAPVDSETAAASFIEQVRSSEPSATHHCWAYRLASGVERSSDDGEPGGTAGPPILRRLESASLADTIAVVTRYYGGTNLGTGGLIRAYGSAAGAAIEAADIIRSTRTVEFRMRHAYDLSGAVEAVLASFDAKVLDAEYTDQVSLAIAVPASESDRFSVAMREATAGDVDPIPADDHRA